MTVKDFVDWCEAVLDYVVETMRDDPTARLRGVNAVSIAERFFNGKFDANEYHNSEYKIPVYYAITALEHAGLLDNHYSYSCKATQKTLDHIQDKTQLWSSICSIRLEPDQVQLLKAINMLSPQLNPEYIHIEEVFSDKLLDHLRWQDETLLRAIATELRNHGLITGADHPNVTVVRATYEGLVWETRRGFTLESKFIDELVQEWETTSVEFKREIGLDTKDQKAEFIKDLIGLANTQASGRRWLIVGFHDKSYAYYGPPDPKVTQNRIEQIIADYIEPFLNIRYEHVDYRLGVVGRLEVLREKRCLPYKVAKALKGNKKEIRVGQIFVRHGSQVEAPTADELKAIQDDGDQARNS